MSATEVCVLLVDDEPEVLEALRRTLRSEGYRLLTAPNGLEAEKVVAAEAVDVLITDLDMPGMGGLELLSRVRAVRPGMARVVLTGAGTLESAMKAINGGEVHRYLTKPWDKKELCDTLRGLVDRLDALRRAAAAGERATAQGGLLADLESRFPGISAVERDGGQYVIDRARLSRLAERLAGTPLHPLIAE